MSRLPRAVGALVAASLLALVGCSAGPSDSPAPADESTPAETESSEYFFEAGELPENPQRIVALWRTGSSLAELGVAGVGQLEGEYLEPELTPEVWETVKDVPTVATYDGIDLEKVIEADPDLIVGMDHGSLGLDYSEVAELFPVRILKIAEPTDVWRNYGPLADLVGKTSDFDAKQAELDTRLTEISDEYGADLGSLQATVIGADGGSIWIDTSKALTYERLTAAGFGYNPAYTDKPERYVTELSLENLPSLADQDIIFYDTELDGSTPAEVQAVLDESAFQELPAVKAGHLYPLRGATVYNFAAANLMVDDIQSAAQKYTGR